MPRPKSEREAWQDELNELPAVIAGHQSELDATHVEDKETRENLLWRIKRDQLRIAELKARLLAD
jgi:septal ring factor EnvC (AmiA/AmiB activator)